MLSLPHTETYTQAMLVYKATHKVNMSKEKGIVGHSRQYQIVHTFVEEKILFFKIFNKYKSAVHISCWTSPATSHLDFGLDFD